MYAEAAILPFRLNVFEVRSQCQVPNFSDLWSDRQLRAIEIIETDIVHLQEIGDLRIERAFDTLPGLQCIISTDYFDSKNEDERVDR